jgi:hypothetical protein
MFVDILSRLSSAQVALIDRFASTCAIMKAEGGWLVCGEISIPIKGIQALTGVDDIHTIDREIDHLITLGIFADGSGLQEKSDIAKLRLTTLALQLYARAQGYWGNPEAFFSSRIVPWNRSLLGERIIDGGSL